MKSLITLSQALGYAFNDEALLITALTHRSKGGRNYEQLEFLGDSILGFVIADYLYRSFPQQSEGKLSRMRTSLVRQETLADIARELHLGDFLLLGEGELKSGGFKRDSILCDVLESIIGAIYLDSGLDQAREFIQQKFASRLQAISPDIDLKDSKSQLQELMQKRGLSLPVYDIVATSGEEHKQDFIVRCRLAELDISAQAIAKSRRQAEQQAAAQVLDRIAKQSV